MLKLVEYLVNFKKTANKITILTALLVSTSQVAAMDALQVNEMHRSMSEAQARLTNLNQDDPQIEEKITKLQDQLDQLKMRMMRFEAALAQKKISSNPSAKPIENVYESAKEAPAAEALTSNDQVANVETEQEALNTVPESLQQPTQKIVSKAFGVTTTIVSRKSTEIVPLGVEPADVAAFKLAKGYFDDKNYEHAERRFHQFIKQHRDSALVSNAYYWLGETFYNRENYPVAAQVFYQGYRVNKKGAKAPDNLYQLANSLILLGNKADACAAFYEISNRYSESHPNLAQVANKSQKKQGCSK